MLQSNSFICTIFKQKFQSSALKLIFVQKQGIFKQSYLYDYIQLESSQSQKQRQKYEKAQFSAYLANMNQQKLINQLYLNKMNKIEDTYFQQNIARNIFIEDFDVDESDYQEEFSQEFQIRQFLPEWNQIVSTSELKTIIIFCPYCGKNVDQNSSVRSIQIGQTEKYCLGHQLCIEKTQSSYIKFQYSKSFCSISKGYLQTGKKSSLVGGKQYVLSLSILHPLSSFKYFKTDKILVKDQGQLVYYIKCKNEDQQQFQPNMIVLPLPQMKVEIKLKELNSESINQCMSFHLDLSQIFVGLQITENQSVWTVEKTQNQKWIVKFEVQLIFNQADKKQLIQQMNFKYKHAVLKNFPLIKINKILLSHKDQIQKSQKFNIEETKASSCLQISTDPMQKIDLSCFAIQNPCLNTGKQISTYSKTQPGSKDLQKQIRQMSCQQIDDFIDLILPYAPQLLMYDYANYMVQTLISVSNFSQRYRFFQALDAEIPTIVSLKQGTFALQQLIKHMNTHEQLLLISNRMMQNFFEIATNGNGNHFLRKVISIIPFYYSQYFMWKMFDNFVDLVNDKNSVCVMKSILKVIKSPIQYESSFHLKTQIIYYLTVNLDQILRNQFGNYFIQEMYEIFGQDQLRQVSEYIFKNFFALSQEKFSSSVICKCVNSYWRFTQYYFKLQKQLGHNQIIDLFENKQGNKVLLQLYSSIDENFKNKIISSIYKKLPSRYNVQKWGGKLMNIKKVKSRQFKSYKVKGTNKVLNHKDRSYNIQ